MKRIGKQLGALMIAVLLVVPSGCATFNQTTGCSEEVGVSILARIAQFAAGAALMIPFLPAPGIAVTVAPHVLGDTTLHQGLFCVGQGFRKL